MDAIKIVISDCHLSAGRFFEGRLNPHEDFFFDDEICDFFNHFSMGEFGGEQGSERNVELLIAGDFLDFLNVPIRGEFEEAVTEQVSLHKLEAIIAGHPKVMRALKKFASRPGKTITYLLGNHDSDLVFASVRERITREWDPQGEFPSQKVKVIGDTDRVTFPGGVEVRHGNQFEAVHAIDFEKPVLKWHLDEPVLNLPWGSVYVLKIVNRMKWERDYIDKVRPAKVFVVFGLILDPWFTLRFAFLSAFYFLKTRFIFSPGRSSRILQTAMILKQETNFLLDLEREAREILESKAADAPEVATVIFGHTHKPMHKIYPDGKQYINTGTWTKMINLDWRGMGRQFCLTFAFVRIRDGKSECELRNWVGEHSPHRTFQG